MQVPLFKQCSVCKEDKQSSEFNRRRAAKDGLYSRCKTCAALLDRIHYERGLDYMPKRYKTKT